jgi:hypothetical protein
VKTARRHLIPRDPEGKRALDLREKGVELVKGRSSFVHHPGFNLLRMAAEEYYLRLLLLGDTSDLASLAAALDGAYGAWVNIDGFTVGEQREIYTGMRILSSQSRPSRIGTTSGAALSIA